MNPPVVRDQYDRLVAAGLGEFDAIHVLARAMSDEFWEMMHQKKPFNLSRYAFALRTCATREIKSRKR